MTMIVLKDGYNVPSGGDREEKDDVFGEALDLTTRRSLRYFFVVGEIL